MNKNTYIKVNDIRYIVPGRTFYIKNEADEYIPIVCILQNAEILVALEKDCLFIKPLDPNDLKSYGFKITKIPSNPEDHWLAILEINETERVRVEGNNKRLIISSGIIRYGKLMYTPLYIGKCIDTTEFDYLLKNIGLI